MGALGLEGRICGDPPHPPQGAGGLGNWTWQPRGFRQLLSIPPSCFGDETPAEQTALKEPPALPSGGHLEAGAGQSPRAQVAPALTKPWTTQGSPAPPPPPLPAEARGGHPRKPSGILPLPTGDCPSGPAGDILCPQVTSCRKGAAAPGLRGQHAPSCPDPRPASAPGNARSAGPVHSRTFSSSRLLLTRGVSPACSPGNSQECPRHCPVPARRRSGLGPLG